MSALAARLQSSHRFLSAFRARSCASGVRVMSFDYRTMKYIPLPPAEIPPPQTPSYVLPKDRPLGQRLALLAMHRSELASKVRLAIKQIELPALKQDDFTALLDAGYAGKDGRFHTLTARGTFAAQAVTEAFARQLGLHEFIVVPGGRFHHVMRCTCGQSFTHSRNEGHWFAAQRRMIARHLASVEAIAALAPIESSPPLQPEA